MQIEARVEPHEPTMLDDVLCGLEGPLVLVAGGDSFPISWLGHAGSLGHEN